MYPNRQRGMSSLRFIAPIHHGARGPSAQLTNVAPPRQLSSVATPFHTQHHFFGTIGGCIRDLKATVPLRPHPSDARA